MQRKVYIFNPGHDLALANGSATFYAPAIVQRMEYDLSLLPIWYADRGGVVLSSNRAGADYFDSLCRQLPSLGESVEVVAPAELADAIVSAENDVWSASPWGWDRSIRAFLKRNGMSDEQLPDENYLTGIEKLSDRRRAVELLPRLNLNGHYIGESHHLTSLESCLDFVRSHSACLFKAPLSGSGKGLNWYRDGIFSSPFERWCRRQLATQGGVVAEPAYDKERDLAIELFIDEKGHASFAGYSFFETSKTGVYQYNLLEPNSYAGDEEWMRRIDSELKPRMLQEVEQMFGAQYRGYLGIDMMICRENGEQLIHPCVEVNLRMTMGIFARIFYDRYVTDGCHGEYHVDYYRKDGEALLFHERMQQQYPPEMQRERLHKGYLSLVPVGSDTRCQAWVIIR